jgi:meso-butanediol dehydrogenase/(S,S)-butanediol dehydrogenase/diacetyl reductase
MRLKDKVAIVTGASSGIGRAIAELFAREGAMVVMADVNVSAGRALSQAITGRRENAVFHEVDVSSATQITQLVEKVKRDFGWIDVLVNAAGILHFGTALDTGEADWNRVVSINLTGTFLCCRAVLPVMIEKGGGSIINLSSSTGAHDAKGNTVAYVASKGGVTLLTKAMAIDHARQNIRVNAIAPGPTDTPMLRGVLSPQEMEEFAHSFPMGRMGRPDELARVALFLATEESSFITGAIIPVDGGQTAEV